MDITPIHRRVVGLDVHQSKITACALIEQPDGSVAVEHREFGGFKRDRRALAEWVRGFDPEVVVMESTGIYWKSPMRPLSVWASWPGWSMPVTPETCLAARPTSPMPSGWPRWPVPVCCGLRSFLRPRSAICASIARQRQKLVGMLAAEKNRLHKVLTDAGIRLNVLVSDVHGASARAMIKALLADAPMHAILDLAGRLRASREELFEALQPEELSTRHRFVLNEVLAHIEYLEAMIARFEQELLAGLAPGNRRCACWKPCPASTALAPPCCSSKSAPTWRASATRNAWLPGSASAPATTRAPVNARADARARATPGSVACCASSRKPPPAPAVRSRTSFRPCPSARDTSAPSWPWRTSSCASSTPCSIMRPLPGPHRRLRGSRRAAQRAALAEDAGKARLSHRHLSRHTGSSSPASRHLRTGMRHARISLAPTSGSFTLTIMSSGVRHPEG
ncbi:ISAfe3, transposase [Thioalkalivibrio nitratireducens DSM 14787]|uniref:ISAfe3, transposase n=1 Tax=Thioalkalivibrio nitratireducens (strain DSM 14787 / UNIQEM 213 / ALEN2) TaxID=1255043 RepID=L0E0U4_THIND|nr:ISAfe3, transposase [Thioalkalivibrio nitratireducens DSM 14787]